jgi:hypothetical protein
MDPSVQLLYYINTVVIKYVTLFHIYCRYPPALVQTVHEYIFATYSCLIKRIHSPELCMCEGRATEAATTEATAATATVGAVTVGGVTAEAKAAAPLTEAVTIQTTAAVTARAVLCRWFRFAQLAKGKKFRP